MNDDKFKKLSDEDMEMISGGKTFTIIDNGSWWKPYTVVDEKNQAYARFFRKSSAVEERENLQNRDVYNTIKYQQLQNNLNKKVMEEHHFEEMETGGIVIR